MEGKLSVPGYKEISDVIINSNHYLTDAQKKTKLIQCNELIRASRTGQLDLLKRAVEYGAAVDYKTCGYSALGYCVFYGYTECVEWLITEARAYIDIPSSGNDTSPLGVAIEKGFIEIVEMLLKNGASPTVKDKDGKSLFLHAVLSGNLDIVKMLYETNMIEPDQDTDAQGNTLIHMAYRSPVVLDYLHNEVNLPFAMQNEQNKTVLHKAVVYKCVESVQYLVDNAPAMINTQDKSGYTALHYAVFYELLDIVKILVKGHARLDIQEYGRFITPLELAKTRTNRMIIRYLQESDPNNTEDLISLKEDNKTKKKSKVKKEKDEQQVKVKKERRSSGRESTIKIERDKLKRQREKEEKKKRSSSKTLFEDLAEKSGVIYVPPGGGDSDSKKKRRKPRTIEELRSNLTLTSRRNRKNIHSFDFEDINNIEEIVDEDDMIEVERKEGDEEDEDEDEESHSEYSEGEADGHLDKINETTTKENDNNDNNMDTSETTTITTEPTTTTTTTTTETIITTAPPVRKRGRPKKDPNAPPTKKKTDDDDFEDEEEEEESDESDHIPSETEIYSQSEDESTSLSSESDNDSKYVKKKQSNNNKKPVKTKKQKTRATRPASTFTSTSKTQSEDEEDQSKESEDESDEEESDDESDKTSQESTTTTTTTTTTNENQPPVYTNNIPEFSTITPIIVPIIPEQISTTDENDQGTLSTTELNNEGHEFLSTSTLSTLSTTIEK